MIGLVIVVLFVVAVAIDVVVGSRLPHEYETSVVEDIGLAVAFGSFALTGALLVAKRPRNAVSWMVAAVGVLASVFQSLDTYGSWVVTEGRSIDPLVILGFWGQEWNWLLLLALYLVFIPLYFPDGRLPSSRWRPWAMIPTLAIVALVLAGMTQSTVSSQTLDNVEVDNPIGIAWMRDVSEAFTVFWLALAFGVILAVTAVVVRFRRARGAERQQLKAFLFALSLLPLLLQAGFVPVLNSPLLLPLIIGALPVAIGVAVLKYRLYGIDRLVSRTVSYAVLTVLLVGVYALGVLGAGALLPGESSDLLVAASTLAVAALFRPLRSRIQHGVDRRFNRARYDAARTVEAFGARLRDQVDLDSLTIQLRRVSTTTLQPRGVSVWLRDMST